MRSGAGEGVFVGGGGEGDVVLEGRIGARLGGNAAWEVALMAATEGSEGRGCGGGARRS